MGKFNKTVPTTATVNKAGGKAFSMGVEQELVHAVLTTFLENKFYEKGNDRVKRIKDLVQKADDVFVAKLAIVARYEFNLRSVVTLLLGELAKKHKGDDLVKRAIVAATNRVDDLTELAAYLGTPLPKQAKRGMRNALLKFNRYQLAKYKGEGKNVSLVDLFNLVHPKAQHANEEQAQAWKDLIAGDLKSFDTWETELSNAKSDEERKEKLEALVAENKIGYMALLRNINNFVKYKVSNINLVLEKLADRDEVKRSRQLPFRFYTAYQHADKVAVGAISQALEHSLDNVPVFEGNTLVAVDVSGSMKSCGAIEKAAMFASAIVRANPTADLILYDTGVKETKMIPGMPMLAIANDIIRLAMGGGTETSLVFKYAEKKGIKYDRIIILSDNESWVESRWYSNGNGVNTAYLGYKLVTDADPYVYAIDIAGYGTKDIQAPKVKHLCGWSDKVLDFMRWNENDDIVAYIKQKDI